jgi:hypothetical protein
MEGHSSVEPLGFSSRGSIANIAGHGRFQDFAIASLRPPRAKTLRLHDLDFVV